MSEIHYQIKIGAPAELVFDALVTPAKLTTWFAEHVEIDLDAERYDFWGNNTPEMPGREEGRHRITAFVPGQVIAYEWSLRGAETEVLLEVEADGDGSVIKLHHHGLPTLKPYQSSIRDFWTHCLEGLCWWLESGTPLEKLDYSKAPEGEVTLKVDINAPRETVFKGLTEPAFLNRWIAKKASVDLKPGGEYSFGWGQGPLKILDIEENKMLCYSWKWEDEPNTIATWTLEGSGGRTRLTVVHSGFAPDRDGEDYFIGWSACMRRLKLVLEGGDRWTGVRAIEDAERVQD